MNYIHSLLSRPWFSYRHRHTSNAVATGDALASSVRLALAVQRPSSCVTAFLSTHPPRTEQQVPTVNKHPEGRTPDTINASGAEPVGAQVAVARVQPETSLQGTLETGEAATAGDSAGGAFRQADRKNAAGDRVNPSERTPIQFADKSNAQQVAPGREQVSPVDTAATHLADEQLKTTRARTSVGEHIDSARTDDAHLHGQDSGTEGLTMEAKVESPNGAKQQGIPAYRQQGEKKVAPKQTQRSSLPSSKRQLAKAFDYRKPGFADPHSNLQAIHHASQAQSKKLHNELTAAINQLADSKAKVLEAFENKQRSEAEYDSLLERLKAQYREAGVPEDEIEGVMKSPSDSWTEAAHQKQEITAADAARAQANEDDWLTEPSAPPSESCLKGRKATVAKGKVSRSKEHKQAPEQQDTDDSAEASLDDSDNEEVVTDITPDSHEAFDQMTSSSFAKHVVAAHGSTRITPSAPSAPHTTAQSAPSHVLAQRRTDIIRLENLSKRALGAWKVQMREHHARVYIQRQPSNLLADNHLRIFLPRDEELHLRPGEVWKIDLHTPKCLRDRGRSLGATLAAEAVEVYLEILQAYLFEFLPGEGKKIVTGRGLRTGGRTFMEVGQMLFRLLSTVVACYTAHEDCGAYTVWLLCPSKADRRLRMM